ncbi:MAG: LacI family DNA-binding transcriptional regulator [Gorillibacterium sp.]|nr:LacI family DNA-binding transcriptional regulator [Gorillibacterium sp.]
MMKKTTISDIASTLGVSEATISLALNNRSGVNKETRKKVLQTAKELGYKPNYFARGLAMRKSNIIGFIIPDIENPFYSKATKILDQVVQDYGYNLLLGFSSFDLYKEKDTIERFCGLGVDGIVIAPTYLFTTDSSYRKTVLESNVPIIYMGAHYDFETHYVMTDLSRGTELLVNHLLLKGIRDIVFLTGSEDIVLVSEREAGFRKAYASQGLNIVPDQYICCNEFSFIEGYRKTLDFLTHRRRPEAIISVNDVMALGVMRASRELGYSIPEHIVVAGYDNVSYSEFSEVSLTTVQQPLECMAKQTILHLMSLILNNISDEWIHEKLEPMLVIRESTEKF